MTYMQRGIEKGQFGVKYKKEMGTDNSEKESTKKGNSEKEKTGQGLF